MARWDRGDGERGECKEGGRWGRWKVVKRREGREGGEEEKARGEMERGENVTEVQGKGSFSENERRGGMRYTPMEGGARARRRRVGVGRGY
jgi:hypothetical protein